MKVNHAENNSSAPTSSSKRSGKAGTASETKEIKKNSHALQSNIAREANEDSKTEISAKSREFAQAKALASGTPDVRESRIADLKQRIESGSYSVNPEAVADKLVDEHLRNL